MTDIEDGGPAYPGGLFENQHGGSNDRAPYYPGMSLRDFFAAAALQGAIAGEANETLAEYQEIGVEAALQKDAKRRAEWCYRQADAMLLARKESQDNG